ncbi:MAG: tRNA 4-thiouridine(8) synthase ThiI, partial [Thermodesulfobacteriota bacterium]|nr:tRNA 4-thiouridine(8) synthase ThiI [Thermodesulfobacteriota bacterium]
MIKGIALFSGGLDSILAIRLIQQQNVNIEAINFATPFLSHDYKTVKEASETLGLPFHVFELSDTYLDMLKKPVYGYGKHMNPCVDCRIFMLKKASEYMKENGASFLVTGEVLGQRPMSQRPYSLKIIERDTGLEGIIVRPLSARLLSPSIPEKNGWIKREELLAIKGRSRIEQ